MRANYSRKYGSCGRCFEINLLMSYLLVCCISFAKQMWSFYQKLFCGLPQTRFSFANNSNVPLFMELKARVPTFYQYFPWKVCLSSPVLPFPSTIHCFITFNSSRYPISTLLLPGCNNKAGTSKLMEFWCFANQILLIPQKRAHLLRRHEYFLRIFSSFSRYSVLKKAFSGFQSGIFAVKKFWWKIA